MPWSRCCYYFIIIVIFPLFQKEREEAWVSRQAEARAIEKTLTAEAARTEAAAAAGFQKQWARATGALSDALGGLRRDIMHDVKDDMRLRLGLALEQALE